MCAGGGGRHSPTRGVRQETGHNSRRGIWREFVLSLLAEDTYIGRGGGGVGYLADNRIPDTHPSRGIRSIS